MGEPSRPDPATIWANYPSHAVAVMAGGPSPLDWITERAIFVASGAHHVDMNQAVLFNGATDTDARRLVDRILPAEVPVLLGCSDGVKARAAAVLERAGFVSLPVREALFWMPGAPEGPDSPAFEVRQLESAADVEAMQLLMEEAHGYERDLTAQMYGGILRGKGPASGWIAWDGEDPVSLAIVTCAAGSLSLWNVLTPPRHRRRGAARAVVGAGLSAVAARARDTGSPIEQTFFWSSPAGRPLYEAMGFGVIDAVDAYVLGATEADLAAIGQ